MSAILDAQTGRRFGRVQFVNDVVDFIGSREGRQPCYDLLDHKVETVTLDDGRGFEWVPGESDAERHDRAFRNVTYLKPSEVAAIFRVDARTVKRWLVSGSLNGFQTPGGHWRISEESVQALQARRLP